jgi:hypothetical protein
MRDQGRALSQRGSFRAYLPTTMRDQAPTQPKETIRRFYNQQHRFYCGIDLHARSMHVCILNQKGRVVPDKNLAGCSPRVEPTKN